MLNRQNILIGAAVLMAMVMAFFWFRGDGRITLNFDDAPVGKVIQSIEHQAGIRIVSNVDPAKPISIHLKRAPLFEALDTVAVRADGDARLAYVGAPDDARIKDVLSAFAAGTNPGGWVAFAPGWGGGGGGMGLAEGGNVDPRKLEWNLSEATDRSLQAFLNQASQKTGTLFAVPKDWNPVLGSLPAKGETGKMAQAIFSAAKGRVQEVVLFTAHPQRPEDDQAPTAGRPRFNGNFQATVFTPERRGRDNMNPQWIAERTEAQIAQLPPDERAQAKADFDRMRAFWESIRDLPPEERRAKMEEMMNDPAVQDRIELRESARDARNTPQQRENRYRRYLERKQAAQGPNT